MFKPLIDHLEKEKIDTANNLIKKSKRIKVEISSDEPIIKSAPIQIEVKRTSLSDKIKKIQSAGPKKSPVVTNTKKRKIVELW